MEEMMGPLNHEMMPLHQAICTIVMVIFLLKNAPFQGISSTLIPQWKRAIWMSLIPIEASGKKLI